MLVELSVVKQRYHAVMEVVSAYPADRDLGPDQGALEAPHGDTPSKGQLGRGQQLHVGIYPGSVGNRRHRAGSFAVLTCMGWACNPQKACLFVTVCGRLAASPMPGRPVAVSAGDVII
jgi:hypothetical protein